MTGNTTDPNDSLKRDPAAKRPGGRTDSLLKAAFAGWAVTSRMILLLLVARGGVLMAAIALFTELRR